MTQALSSPVVDTVEARQPVMLMTSENEETALRAWE